MKIIRILFPIPPAIIIFLFACSTVTKNDKQSEQELILSNKIKSVKEYVTTVHWEIKEKEHLHSIKLYNVKGLLTKETVFMDSGIDYITTHEYDSNGNRILSVVNSPDGRLVSKYTRTYDENNNLKEFLHFESLHKSYMIGNTNDYDSKGRKIETDWFTPSRSIAIEKFKYDGMEMIEDADYDFHGQFQFKWIYKYDEAGNLIEAVQYYPDSLINSKITYEYNKDNEMVKQTNYLRGTIQDNTIYEYDKKHLLTAKTECSSPGKISAIYRYQYE